MKIKNILFALILPTLMSCGKSETYNLDARKVVIAEYGANVFQCTSNEKVFYAKKEDGTVWKILTSTDWNSKQSIVKIRSQAQILNEN